MNVVFLGGGSFRIPPFLRDVFRSAPVFREGEIRLVDFNLPRAEMVKTMLQRVPEYPGPSCKITVTDRLEKALEGADVLYVTMGLEDPKVNHLSTVAGLAGGFICTDQLSVNGAFLALRGGAMILDFARKMERICPNAWLMSFANPSAVYSGVVNHHTKIRALGLCHGSNNHRWDLTRMLGRDEYCRDYDVLSAGVNHCALILEGTYHGRDLFDVMREHYSPAWQPPKITKVVPPDSVLLGLAKMWEMLHRFGVLFFSCEFDGMAHLFYEDVGGWILNQSRIRAAKVPRDVDAWAAAQREKIRRQEDQYAAVLDGAMGPEFWKKPPAPRDWYDIDPDTTALAALKALAGMGPQRVVASFPNRGAVAGFKDRAILEDSMTMDGDSLKPVKPLEIPDSLHGRITALAEHQTLLGDAIGAGDPKLFADALAAYPIRQNTSAARQYFRNMLDIHKDRIPDVFQHAREYL